MSPFIPPEKAMQFEVTHCPYKAFEGTAIWTDGVMRDLAFPQDECGCVRGMRVLNYREIGLCTNQGGIPCVCEHMGRIVE